MRAAGPVDGCDQTVEVVGLGLLEDLDAVSARLAGRLRADRDRGDGQTKRRVGTGGGC